MPNLLEISLDQQHKSFDSGFSCQLEGELVILSGVNGSGKSQLLEIIGRRPIQQAQASIQAKVLLNGSVVSPSEVVFRSFKENINIQEISQASPQALASMHSQVWTFYSQDRLNEANQNLAQQGLTTAARRARLHLMAAYGPDRFDSGALTPEEIKRGLPPEFAWKSNDSFTNEIGEIFFAYCLRKRDAEAKAGRIGTSVDYAGLGAQPWLQLNELFSELKLDYRFRTAFELSGIEINEQPRIFHAAVDGSADPDRPRNLSDLSDGEKAIISLCFASLRSAAPGETKVVLLDEFDSTLNPSLTEMFYTVLQRYFIERGIQVVVATHSIATLSLAPPYASFYEVYRRSISSSNRILPVERSNYAELQKVTRIYQSSMTDQGARFDEIKQQNDELLLNVAALEAQLREMQQPMIVTEGPTDVAHLQAASSNLQLDSRLEIEYFDQSKLRGGFGSANLNKYLEHAALTPNAKRIIGVFDRDEPAVVKKIGDFFEYGNNVFAFCIPVPTFRAAYSSVCIEFLYSDEAIKKEHDGKRLFFTNEIAQVAARGGDKATPSIRVIDPPDEATETAKSIYNHDVSKIMKDGQQVAHSKAAFAKLISDDAKYREGIDFSGFRPVFQRIQEILDR